MRMRKLILTTCVLTLLAAGRANAAPAEFQFNLAFSPSLPRGEFHDVLGRTAWGGSIGFGFRPSRSPVMIGTSFSFGIYDTDRWEEWLGLTNPDVLVDVRTTNAILAWNIFLRLQPREGFLRPYVDIFAGLHILTTDTRVGEGDSDDDDDFRVNNSVDTAFAYGAGRGFSSLSSGSSNRTDAASSPSISIWGSGMRWAAGPITWSKPTNTESSIRGLRGPTS